MLLHNGIEHHFLIPVANTTYILVTLFYNPTSSYFQIPRF